MSLRLAIIVPNLDTITETFIKAHIDHLKGHKYILHGYYPMFKENGHPIESFFKERMPLLKKTESILPYFIAFRIKHKRRLLNSHEVFFERYIEQRKVNVVLAEYGTTGADIAPICAKLGIPLIVHFHGFDAYQKNILYEKMSAYREMFANAVRLIAVSNHMKNQLISIGAPKDKVVCNPYGPKSDFNNLKPDYASNQIISVGRFVGKKAPYLTLDAFRRVLVEYPDLKLTMVGDGPLLPVCKNLANAWGIKDKVQFTGAVTHEKVIQFMEASFCFVQHSLTADNGDNEGTPVAILEAGAAALPVVATKHGGINDVVIHGETGFLVDEGDVDSMAFFIIKLASQRDTTKKIGSAARVNIDKNFSIEKHISTLQAVFTDVLKTVV